MRKKSISEMQKLAESRGGACLSLSYKNNKTKLLWRCRNNHIWQATPNNIARGSWCPECRIFLREELCRTTFEQIFGKNFNKSYPIWLKSRENTQLELDGYCEELALAFEYQGEQHFKAGYYVKTSADLEKRKQLDIWKRQRCNAAGITLIEIFYWDDPHDYPNLIKSRLGLEDGSIAAGNFEVEIDFNRVYEHRSKLDEMCAMAQSKGGLCISNKFISLGHPLRWRCEQGHEWISTGSRVKRGDWCNECAGRKRRTIEYVKEIASKRGGKCLSDKYLNNKTKLLFQCRKGHEWLAIPNAVINRGHWCPFCAKNSKGTLMEMHEIAKARGGSCRSHSYENDRVQLVWECALGHVWNATARDVKKGTWCPNCNGNPIVTTKDMHELAKMNDGRFLSATYKGSSEKHLWECKMNHKWEATPNSIKSRGTWCPTCAGNVKSTIDEMKLLAAERSGKCLSDIYINSTTKLQWECTVGHVWWATPRDIKFGSRNRKTGERKGTWCPTCAKLIRTQKSIFKKSKP